MVWQTMFVGEDVYASEFTVCVTIKKLRYINYFLPII